MAKKNHLISSKDELEEINISYRKVVVPFTTYIACLNGCEIGQKQNLFLNKNPKINSIVKKIYQN